MSITRRIAADGKPRYQVRVEVGDPITGRRKRVTVGTFRTKREAEQAEAQATTEQKQGTLLMPDTTAVGQLLDRWLELEVPRTVQPENATNYAYVIRKHLKPALGNIPVQKLRVEHVERLYAQLQSAGYSTSLIKKCHMRLSSALRMATRWGLVSANVCDSAKVPRMSYKKAEVWTPNEVSSFLEVAASHSLAPYWCLALETGARTSELLGLSWEDVDLDRGRIRFGHRVVRLLDGSPIVKDGAKTEAGHRTVLLTEGMVEELRRYRVAWAERQLRADAWDNPHDLVFCTASGRPINPTHMRQTFNRLVAQAGVRPITPHGMRKTHITSLVAAGGNIKAIAARVGHRDVTTTLKTYTQLIPQMESELLELVTRVVRADEQSA
jgi:integrase